MHQQAQIDDGCLLPTRRAVQHQPHRLAVPIGQDLPQKLLPDGTHHDALIRHKAGEAPFNTRHLGLRQSTFRDALGDALQDRTARQDHAQHHQRQGFLLMPMHAFKELLDLFLPLFP